MNDKPLYEHDCTTCVFLGTYETFIEKNSVVADLYYCDHGDATVIARYSSEGSDYSSGLHFIMHNPHLNEAWRRALEADLVRPEIIAYMELDSYLRDDDGFSSIVRAIDMGNTDPYEKLWDIKYTCKRVFDIMVELMFDKERARKFKEQAPERAAKRAQEAAEWDAMIKGEDKDDN